MLASTMSYPGQSFFYWQFATNHFSCRAFLVPGPHTWNQLLADVYLKSNEPLGFLQASLQIDLDLDS